MGDPNLPFEQEEPTDRHDELTTEDKSRGGELKSVAHWPAPERDRFVTLLRNEAYKHLREHYALAFEVLLEQALTDPKQPIDRVEFERRMNEKYRVLTNADERTRLFALPGEEDKNITLVEDVLPPYNYVGKVRACMPNVARRFGGNFSLAVTKTQYRLILRGSPPSWWGKDSDFNVIGVLVANAADWFTGELLQGITETARTAGCSVLIEESRDEPLSEWSRIERLARRSNGLLVIPTRDHLSFGDLKIVEDIPTVLVDRYIRGLKDVPFVHHDDYLAGRAAARFLIQNRSCRRIIIIQPRSRYLPTQLLTPLLDRIAGAEAEAEELERQALPAPQMEADELGGYEALKLFATKFGLKPTDGIFATTDKAAVGCRYFLQSLSKKEEPGPALENVIGFEGQSIGDFLSPQLASIAASNAPVGQLATRVLLQKLNILKDNPPEAAMGPHHLVLPKILIPEDQEGQKRREVPLDEFFGEADFQRLRKLAQVHYTQSSAGAREL